MSDQNKCPKCGHIRQEAEEALEGQCPSCGVFYAKYVAAKTRDFSSNSISNKQGLSAPHKRKSSISIPKHVVFGIGGLVMGILITTLYMGQRSSDQKPPGSASTQEVTATKPSAKLPEATESHPLLKGIRMQLKDPRSAQFEQLTLVNGETGICGFLNAKNAIGGYTGLRPFFAVPGNATIYKEVFEDGTVGSENLDITLFVAEAMKAADGGEVAECVCSIVPDWCDMVLKK